MAEPTEAEQLEAQGRPRRGRRRRSEPRKRSSVWGRLGLLALIPFVLYTLYTVAEKSVATYRLRHEAAVVRAEIEAERQENLRLQRALVEARGDEEIEDAARRYLNLVKPGDNPVVISNQSPPPVPTPVPRVGSPPADEMPTWLRWVLEHLRL